MKVCFIPTCNQKFQEAHKWQPFYKLVFSCFAHISYELSIILSICFLTPMQQLEHSFISLELILVLKIRYLFISSQKYEFKVYLNLYK